MNLMQIILQTCVHKSDVWNVSIRKYVQAIDPCVKVFMQRMKMSLINVAFITNVTCCSMSSMS